LQALLLLNDTTYIEAARVLAARLLSTPPEARAQRLFLTVLGRVPTDAESTILRSGVQRHLTRFTANPEAARKLVSTGESPNPSGLDPIEQAAWTLACSTVLNLDEALSKE
jgi:hypothetical protein